MNKLNIVFIFLMTLLISACGGGANNGTGFAPVGGSTAYNGPGSKWNVQLANGRFKMDEEVAGTIVNGSYTINKTGFYKLVVTSSSGTGAPAAGSVAYGLEIPGIVFLVKPYDDATYNTSHHSDKIIPMVFKGECPSGDFTANWVMNSRQNTFSTATTDIFGTFSYNFGGKSASLPNRYLITGADQGSNNIGSAPCTAGIMTPEGARMFLTPTGAAVVHLFQGDDDSDGVNEGDNDDSFVIALPKDTILNTNDLNGVYSGIVFAESGTNTDTLFPIQITMNGGIGTGAQLTDPDAGTLSSSTITLNLSTINSPSAGFISGTITNNSGTGNVYCSSSVNVDNSGKNFLFCVGQQPAATSRLYNLMLISR